MLIIIQNLTEVIPNINIPQNASMVVAGIIGAGASAISGIFGAISAGKAKKAAAKQAAAAAATIASLERSRQAVINPYADVKDMSALAKDTSNIASNPFASLGVATQAAKMQADEADISLANTLDTLRETGAGAGGATALANAALKSKQGISASIEQQEADNSKLAAQGEQQLQQTKMAEQQRIQSIQISEAGRAQEAQAQGKAFAFNATENRQQGALDRASGQLAGAQQRQAQAQADQTGAITGAIGGIASVAGSYMSAKGSQPAAINTGITDRVKIEEVGGGLTAGGLVR